MDLLLERMDRRGPRRRSHGFRVLNDRSKAAGARRRHVPYRPGRQDILDREGGRRGGHGGRGTRPRDLARSESYLFGGQRTSRERSFACVDVVSPPSHILLVVALQLVLQTLRRIIVEISVAGYPGTILKRARRLRHRRTRSRRITRIGTLYHVTGIVTRDRNFHRYNEIYTCIFLLFLSFLYKKCISLEGGHSWRYDAHWALFRFEKLASIAWNRIQRCHGPSVRFIPFYNA